MCRYPCGWVAPFGYPRINACSRLPVAFRSVPRPSSPPGAKASTECPSYTRYPGRFPKSRLHHAQKPSSGAVVRVQSSVARSNRDGNDRLFEDSPGNIYSAHNRILSNRSSVAACASTARNSTKSFTTPLNPRRQPLGCYPHRQQFPVRQFGRTTHQFSGVSCQGSEPDRPAKPMHQHLLMTRPETHQNLIHTSKEQYHPTGQHKRHDHTTLGALPRPMIRPNSGHSAILIDDQRSVSVVRRTSL